MPTIIAPQETDSTVDTTPEFGSGKYSAAMKEIWKDGMFLFHMSSEVAEKVARQFGSDFGAAMKNAPVDARVSKSLNKDGKVTLAESSKVKNVTCTNAMSVARAIDYANGALKAGVDRKTTGWKFRQELQEWVDSLKLIVVMEKADAENAKVVA